MKRAIIETMFRAVDGERWSELKCFYHPRCTYERPGFEPIHGVDAVLHFYIHDRPLRCGSHLIEDVVESERTACAIGAFEGRLRSGPSICLRFADHYVFEDTRILERRTFFYAALA